MTPVGLFVDAPTETILAHGPRAGPAARPTARRRDTRAGRALSAADRDQGGPRRAGRFADDAGRRGATRSGAAADEPRRFRAGNRRHRASPAATGVANDWETVIEAQRRRVRRLPPIIAAGGLTPETSARVIRAIRPYAVDVSSGVESSPACKSEEKIAAFVGRGAQEGAVNAPAGRPQPDLPAGTTRRRRALAR